LREVKLISLGDNSLQMKRTRYG